MLLRITTISIVVALRLMQSPITRVESPEWRQSNHKGRGSIFANHWMDDTCCAPNRCEGTDFDKSGAVDALDLARFAEYWLEGTD